MKRRPSQNLWGRRDLPYLRIAIVAVTLVLVGLLAYRQLDRWRGDAVNIWVAASDLEAGTGVAAEDPRSIQLRRPAVPKGTVINRSNIEGAELVRPKAMGAMFVDGDLRRVDAGPGPGLAGSVPEGRVLMAYTLPGFPIAELADMLRLGDHFDVFSFLRGEPLHIAHDAIFLGWIRPREPANNNGDDESVGGTLASALTDAAAEQIGPRSAGSGPSPLLLGVRPEDVRRMVWAKNSGLPLTAILHGKAEADEEALLGFPADPRPRSAEVEVILGKTRERLPLEDLR